MNIKSILLFVGGLSIGGAAGILGTKKYLQEKYEKLFEDCRSELEEYYHRTDEYKRVEHDEEKESEDNVEFDSKEGTSRPGGRMSSEERIKVKEQLNRNWEGTTNYAKMYKGDRVKIDPVDDAAESEYPKDQGEEGEEDPDMTHNCRNCFHMAGGLCSEDNEEFDYDAAYVECDDFKSISPEEEVFDEHQKNKNKPPKIISAEDYSNLPAHINQEVLYFYAYDEILTDDEEEPIEDPAILIGDALTKYGFADNDEQIIFVMNYATDTCYEIQKVDANWTETH